MYADVVVLTYQSPDIPTYTYKIPKELEKEIKVGQLVSVPFGKRLPMGVVTNLGSQIIREVGDIRDISEILLNQPLLLRRQIELLKWMAFYYHAPMVNCLEAILPEIPKKLTYQQAHPRGVLASSSTRRSGPGSTLAHPGGEGNAQTLVLVPSISRISETLASYPRAKNYVIYYNERKVSDKFNAWLKILNGSVDFIFGSRSAIFTPCPNLGKIIIFDEHDGAYKDERSPYFDTFTVAEKNSEITGCELEIIDSSPRVTTFFAHRDDIGKVREVREVGIKIVSMLEEKAKGNKSPISDLLYSYLKAAVKKQKKVLLFLNKKSESGHFYCKSCKFNDWVLTQPEACPNCQSQDLWFYSLNVNSLASLVQKLVPTAKINIISTQPALPARQATQLATIEIATASVFYKLTYLKYDLVAHIATDSTLNILDFSSSEKAFTQITSLQKLAKGLLLLQTYNPDHPVIKTAASGNYNLFYKYHLLERKALLYPPYSLLVKLTIKGKKEEGLEERTQKLFDALSLIKNSLNSKLYPLITILGPYRSIFGQKYKKYNIILKIATDNYSLKTREKAIKSLDPFWKMIPRDWQITIEPDSIN